MSILEGFFTLFSFILGMLILLGIIFSIFLGVFPWLYYGYRKYYSKYEDWIEEFFER